MNSSAIGQNRSSKITGAMNAYGNYKYNSGGGLGGGIGGSFGGSGIGGGIGGGITGGDY